MKTKEAAIAAIFSSDQNHLLLTKRRDVAVWVLPGGGLSQGETAEEAAIREVYEETGFHVSIVRKVAEYSPLNRWMHRAHFFECKILSGEATNGNETQAVAFFPLHQLPKAMFELHRDWLEDLQKNQDTMIQKPIAAPFRRILIYALKHPYLFLRYLLSRLGIPINKG